MADNVTNHTHAQYAHKGHNHDEYYANVNHTHATTTPVNIIGSSWGELERIAVASTSTNENLIFEGSIAQEDTGTHLVSIKYTTSNNSLTDQSLHAVKFSEVDPISASYNLVKTAQGSDNLTVVYNSSLKKYLFTIQYSGTGVYAHYATIKII